MLLSPSGDLGIGLVWDNPTGPDRTTFRSDCWSPLQTELKYLWRVLSCSQDDIRWLYVFRCSQLFSDVFSWVLTFMDNHPLCKHFFSGCPLLITSVLSWNESDSRLVNCDKDDKIIKNGNIFKAISWPWGKSLAGDWTRTPGADKASSNANQTTNLICIMSKLI